MRLTCVTCQLFFMSLIWIPNSGAPSNWWWWGDICVPSCTRTILIGCWYWRIWYTQQFSIREPIIKLTIWSRSCRWIKIWSWWWSWMRSVIYNSICGIGPNSFSVRVLNTRSWIIRWIGGGSWSIRVSNTRSCYFSTVHSRYWSCRMRTYWP